MLTSPHAPRKRRAGWRVGLVLSALLAAGARGQILGPGETVPGDDLADGYYEHSFALKPDWGSARKGGEERADHPALILPEPPVRIAPFVTASDALVAAGRLEEAAAMLQKALDAAPDHPALLIRGGHLATARGQYFLAEDYWARMAEAFPTNAWVKGCWGGLLLRVERLPQAQRVLEEALELNPGELVAKYNLACVQLARFGIVRKGLLGRLTATEVGQLATWVRDDFEALAAFLPGRALWVLCEAVLTGRMPMGRARVEDPAAGQRDRMAAAAAALWSAYCARQGNDWAGTAEALDEARRLGVRRAEVDAEHALCRFLLGDEQEAARELMVLIRRDRDNPVLATFRGQMLLEIGRYAEAVTVLRSAHRQKPQDPEIALFLAAGLAAVGRMGEASDMAEDVVRRFPRETRERLSRKTPYFRALLYVPALEGLAEPTGGNVSE